MAGRTGRTAPFSGNPIKVVSSNPVQRLNMFLGLGLFFSSSVMAAFYHHVYIKLLQLDIYYYGIHILEMSITSTEHKGPTHTQPFSCGFDGPVGRALHR